MTKILAVYPGPMYPVQGMSQVRAINQISRLAADHEIYLVNLVSNQRQLDTARQELQGRVKGYFPVYLPSFRQSRLVRAFGFTLTRLRWLASFLSIEEISLSARPVKRQLRRIAEKLEYDCLLIHYWYLGYMFDWIKPGILKVMDTHYLVEENQEIISEYRLSGLLRFRMGHELSHCAQRQDRYFQRSDLIIVNSVKQRYILLGKDPSLYVDVTVNGQDIGEYLEYRAAVESKSILFYGALSNQFNRKGLERLLAVIYPRLRQAVPDLKLYIVGSCPPNDIIVRYPCSGVVVTGFVEDIKPVVASRCLMILPLETGSGFRGRIVETMALGVPVVGTNNALQSVGLVDGEEGFIADANDQIVAKALEIIQDESIRDRMSIACRHFAETNFSLECTFGVLSRKLSDLIQGKRSGE